jgi:hypothetical protein
MSSRYQTSDPDSNTVPLSYAQILYANAQATSTDEKYVQEMLFTEYFEQSILHCVSQKVSGPLRAMVKVGLH